MIKKKEMNIEELKSMLEGINKIIIEQANRNDLPESEKTFEQLKLALLFSITEIDTIKNNRGGFVIDVPMPIIDAFHKQKYNKTQLDMLKDLLLTIIEFIRKSDVFHYIYSKVQLDEEQLYFKNKKEEIDNIILELQQLKTEHALRGFKELYANESEKQNKTSKIWLTSAWILALLLMASIGCCFYFNAYLLEETNKSLFIFANEITFNLVLLSIMLWCARMYSINKALQINYQHKSVSADALLPFMAAITEDPVTKNTILLESSRVIFAVPETNLAKKDTLNLKLLETFKDISQTSK